jgi:hypothetical protein
LICRIKYNKLKSGELQSDEIISCSGVSYYAKFDFESGCWRIFNAKRRNVIKEGFSKNRNVLRRMVRRELQKLGVKLEKEFKKSGYATTKS